MLRASSKTAGVTLLELMFVIALIGIMSAAAYPGVTEGILAVKVSSASSKLIRIGKNARARAKYSNLAHTIAWFVDANGNENMAVFRGDTARCNAVNWPTLDENAPHDPNDRVNAGHADFSNGGGSIVRIVPTTALAANIQICIQPDGTTLYRQGNGGVFTRALGGVADFRISVYSQVGGAPRGMVRQVVFPNGSAPRAYQ